jgi:DNA repair protein RecN (Recombination protein N)
MEKLARHHQIFCITHHASIAARAGHHASVRKSQSKGETFTNLVHLDGQERLDELAQMMGGKQSGDAARELARQLME